MSRTLASKRTRPESSWADSDTSDTRTPMPDPPATKGEKKAQPPDTEAEEGGSEEVYEVQEIVGVKGTGKSLRYLVRWKGYGPEDDTWEPESGLNGAQEILEAFKRTWKDESPVPEKKAKGRTSTASTRVRPRASAAGSYKGRQPSSDEEEAPAKKKARKSGGGGIVAKEKETIKRASVAKPNEKKGKKLVQDDTEGDSADEIGPDFSTHSAPDALGSQEEEEEEEMPKNDWHEKYAALTSWEDKVDQVSTIEQDNSDPDKGDIRIHVQWTDGAFVWLPNAVARKKFPQKLIDFYQSNLSFATQEGQEMDTDKEAVTDANGAMEV